MMLSVRRAVLYLLFVIGAFSAAACSAPPDKEIQQAKSAIDAARAAGADQYAREELAAAQEALKRSAEAVEERDYRLALSHALDSRERAETAAKEAADQKATARTNADRAVASASAALVDLRARLKAAEAGKAPARLLAEVHQTVSDVDRRMQETRAAYEHGDYTAVTTAAKDASARLEKGALALRNVPRPAAPRRR
jgi:hypothetical protein